MAINFGSSLFKKSRAVLGVDISSTAVKVLQLEAAGTNYQVSAYASAVLPKGAVVKGVIEKPGDVADALQRCVDRSGAKVKQIAMAMPSNTVTTRVLVFPGDFAEQSIYEQIEADAHLHIPFPLDDVRFDFSKIGVNGKNKTDIDVLLAASRREQVDGRINVAEAVGLDTSIVDIESFCVQRCVAQSARLMPKNGQGLILAHIDIGAVTTTLTVVQDHDILFQREQPFGGQQLTLDIAKQYGLSPEDAEIKKRLNELPADYEKRVLEPFLLDAAQVAARSLQVFYTSTPFGRVDQVLLAGGSAGLSGLLDAVTRKTQVPVVLFDPFEGYEVHSRVNRRQLEQDAPGLTVACGLAMRAFGRRK
jgi:type IV pilus assembly protein PilM